MTKDPVVRCAGVTRRRDGDDYRCQTQRYLTSARAAGWIQADDGAWYEPHCATAAGIGAPMTLF